MTILVKWNDKLYQAQVVADHKVVLLGLRDKELEAVELEQCRECGGWKSEDEELYGDGYCTNCAAMCTQCEKYYNAKDVNIIDGERVCKTCIEKFKQK